MSKRLRIFSTLANIIIGIVLVISVFETRQYYYDYGHGIVLSILRYFLAHFVLVSEIPLIKPFYLKHFRFYMFPLGRSLMYAFLSISSFSLIWYGIVNIIVLGIITVITFIISLYHKGEESPYMPINENEPPNNSPGSALPSYQTFSTDDGNPSNPTEACIKVVST
ncbi:hypothetical protein K502DRAFT_346268 [Neoconidiobolus thromboides FSU 785]|nr:hypothetical protein K502DRAFT_346268 [Neoconidiobolus thromboides FSU 785]